MNRWRKSKWSKNTPLVNQITMKNRAREYRCALIESTCGIQHLLSLKHMPYITAELFEAAADAHCASKANVMIRLYPAITNYPNISAIGRDNIRRGLPLLTGVRCISIPIDSRFKLTDHDYANLKRERSCFTNNLMRIQFDAGLSKIYSRLTGVDIDVSTSSMVENSFQLMLDIGTEWADVLGVPKELLFGHDGTTASSRGVNDEHVVVLDYPRDCVSDEE